MADSSALGGASPLRWTSRALLASCQLSLVAITDLSEFVNRQNGIAERLTYPKRQFFPLGIRPFRKPATCLSGKWARHDRLSYSLADVQHAMSLATTKTTELAQKPHCNTFVRRMLELSIVIPCLNEAETLECCIRKAQRFLTENGFYGEVIVADNGSSDGSQCLAI
jgi:hypothetical protein